MGPNHRGPPFMGPNHRGPPFMGPNHRGPPFMGPNNPARMRGPHPQGFMDPHQPPHRATMGARLRDNINCPPHINLDAVLMVTQDSKHKQLDTDELYIHFHRYPIHINPLPLMHHQLPFQTLLYFSTVSEMEMGLRSHGSIVAGVKILVHRETNKLFVSNPWKHLMHSYKPPTFDLPTLHITHFPWGTTKEELQGYFSSVAPPDDILIEKSVMGFPNRAFLFYKSEEEASAGLELDESLFKNKKLKVTLNCPFKQGMPQLLDVAKQGMPQLLNMAENTLNKQTDINEDDVQVEVNEQAETPVEHSIEKTGQATQTEIDLQDDGDFMMDICFPDAIDVLYTYEHMMELSEDTGNIPIIVTNVVDDFHFWGWVLSEENIEVLSSYIEKHERMKEITEKFNPESDDERVGVYHNAEWYRGMVCQVCEDKAEVFLVDYGSHETVALEDLAPLPEFFWDDAPMAVPFRILENRTGGSLSSYLETRVDALCVEHETGKDNVIKIILLEVPDTSVTVVTTPTLCTPAAEPEKGILLEERHRSPRPKSVSIGEETIYLVEKLVDEEDEGEVVELDANNEIVT